MISRQGAQKLLEEYIKNENLVNHCEMVAKAMEAYAKKLEKSGEEIEKWWVAGLLHDLDWEKYPDEHPNKAVSDIFPNYDIPGDVIEAIKAHAPERTGKSPEAEIEKYLFACDEISGFLNAVSMVRPSRFEGMKVKSVKKRLKSERFAAGVNRDDVRNGADLIEKPLEDHIEFLIEVFQN